MVKRSLHHSQDKKKKFHRNRSILHCLQDKYAFAFYAEIQDACQKWQESDFLGKSPVDSAYTVQVKKIRRNCSISHHFRDIKDFSFSALRKNMLFS